MTGREKKRYGHQERKRKEPVKRRDWPAEKIDRLRLIEVVPGEQERRIVANISREDERDISRMMKYGGKI